MNICHSLCLHAVKAFRGERSIAGLYYLLQGKRSAQTIQDGHFYQVLPLFGVLSRWEKEKLDKVFEQLAQNGYIDQMQGSGPLITDAGEKYIELVNNHYPAIAYLDGWNMKDATISFWRRLSLFIQCLSNLSEQNQRFIPVAADRKTLEWVKRFLFQVKDRKAIEEAIYQEVLALLEEGTELEAEIFVYRLSGNELYGKTNDQIAELLHIPVDDCYLIFLASLHRIMGRVLRRQDEFQLLYNIVQDLFSTNLTSSASVTNKYVEQGYALTEIASMRDLKLSTIEDHIIEIAIATTSFDISFFVNEQEQNLIRNAIKQASSIRLREIKEFLPSSISYFKIRLVLARGGGNNDQHRGETIPAFSLSSF